MTFATTKVMTTQEAADKWGTTQAYVKKLCLTEKIPSARQIGRQWIIDKDASNPMKK